jgi:hypothetical protein
MCARTGVIDQPGAAPLSAIDQPAAPSSVSCACGACWNAPDAVAEITAVTVRAAKMNFFMGLSPVSFALLADKRLCRGCGRRDLKRFTHHVTFIVRKRAGDAQGQRDGGGDHHTLIDKSGAATVSVIDQAAETSFVVGRSCGDCRNVPAVDPQNMAVKARAVKTNFFMGRNPTR